MSRPVRVSAAITTYNQAAFLERALESVYAQTRPPDEIVVVDDGSTDSTPQVLERHRSRVRVIRQPNGGVARARNRAVQEVTGDLIALLDGDDLWHPSKLQVCVEAAETQGASVIVHGIQAMSVDESRSAPGPIRDYLERLSGGAVPTLIECWDELVTVNFIWTTTQVVLERRLYLDVGMSDPRFRIGSDYDLYLRLARRTRFLLIPDILASWRQHDASASGRGADRMLNWARETVNVLQRHAVEDEASAKRLKEHAARTLAALNRQLYCGEPVRTPLQRAARLLTVAKECRAPSSAALAIAVLFPYPVRRAVSALSGRSVSATLRAGAERSF